MSLFTQSDGYCWEKTWDEMCKHPEHFPPMHLYIPPNTYYEHICPACGNIISIGSNQITYHNPNFIS